MTQRNFTLRHLQLHQPWTVPYSEEFDTSNAANGFRQVGHDVLHAMKSLGRIAAEVERADHGRERKLVGVPFHEEVASVVMCALHIASIEGFDLGEAVVAFMEEKNGVIIPFPPERTGE